MQSGRRMGNVIGLALVIIAGLLPTALADTLYVNSTTGNDVWDGRCEAWDGATCGPKATIQAGIDAATAGDEVVIADGTYTGLGNKNLDFLGKAITVRSASGDPALCVIDCEGAGRGFYFHSGEGTDSIVDSLTVTNGSPDPDNLGSTNGGGILCVGSSPTFTNCTVSGNSTPGYGGGFHLQESSASLAACTIADNSAYGGAGLQLQGGDATISDCVIRGNVGKVWGGGVTLAAGNPTLTGCTIIHNTCPRGEGGGVLCRWNGGTFQDCTIRANVAVNGGGLGCSGSAAPTFTNCTISENLAGSGAGISNSSDYLTLVNCTICRNTASAYGGGLSGGSSTLTNCILWGDVPEEIFVATGAVADPIVTYCDVQGGWIGEGNIDADPQFAFSADGRLMPGSPCIDAGTNTPSGGLPAYDRDGNPRPLDGNGDAAAVADIGAYEFNPAGPSIAVSAAEFTFVAPESGEAPPKQTLFVRNCSVGTLSWAITGAPAWLMVTPPSGTSAGDVDRVTLRVDAGGLSYGTYTAALHISDEQAANSPRTLLVVLHVVNALHVPSVYPTIQAAIDAAGPRDVVVIADGTYTGVGNKDLDYGGKRLTVRSASGNPAQCVIDCEGEGRGFYFHNRETPESIVEGLTITNGYMLTGSGGGVCCLQNAWPVIRNCAITGNRATMGAGLFCYNSSPTLIGCTVDQNYNGGGVSASAYSRPTLIACTINGNSDGGVVCGNSSTLTLSDCSINGNFGSWGGGVQCSYLAKLVLRNCTICGNEAYYSGGGIRSRTSSVLLANCTIGGNVAPQGAAIACESDAQPSSLVLTNCILWNDGDEIWNDDGSTVELTYCDVDGGWTGAGNIDADPLFVDPDGPDNDPNTWADNDYRLAAGSPCIDAGSNAAVPSDVLFDLDGLSRIADGNGDGVAIVDMGAYERPATVVGDVNCDGVVNFGDINPFVLALTDPVRYATEHPGCPILFADINQDGAVTFGDINPFVELLLGR